MADHDALYARLARRGGGTRTEADIQSDIKLLLLSGGLDLDEGDLEVYLEAQAAGKRIDIEIGFTVIEVKRDVRRADVLTDATEQLEGYVAQRTEATKQRYVGIVTDGHDWYLYTLGAGGTLELASKFEHHDATTAPALISWLSTVLATTEHVSATPAEIDRRFGADSPAHDLDMIALRTLWDANQSNEELLLKKSLWGKLLRTALGELVDVDVDLFLRHTYLVITAELIAHEVLGVNITGLDSIDLVTGKAFRDAGVYGVVESDFFDWPAELDGGDKIVRAIARRVAQIDWAGTEHDLLKHLYESVIAPAQRHRLGEYYTPDWLAEAVVGELVDAPTSQRVLDPACGSGTFVFHSVRRVLTALDNQGVSNREALRHVTTHVLGMDVHPVAVTLARVTYLLALGTQRLHGNRDELSIPVYLGDSVQWQMNHSVLNADGLTVATSDGYDLFAAELFFPAAVLGDPAAFDRLVATLVDRATARVRGARPIPSIRAIIKPFALSEADSKAVEQTFHILCDLHDHHRNHIWGYYVRNLARPRWLTQPQSRVDRIVGNPPWLAYRFMGTDMQAAFRVRCQERNIWAGGRVTTQQDLAAYFVVRCSELYLREGGRFGMVMPLATLSRKPTAGFRRGIWGVAGTAAFDAGWDLDQVKPAIFPVPACVITGTFHPVHAKQDAVELKGSTEAWSGTVRKVHWSDVSAELQRVPTTESVTVGAPRSPYSRDFMEGATIVPRVLHVVQEVATTGGLGLPAGVVNVTSVRSSLEKGVWKTLPSRGPVAIERKCIHPMHLGSTLLPFRLVDPWKVVLPIDPHTKALVGDGGATLVDFPRADAWWIESEQLWDTHSKGSMALMDRINFQGTLKAQLPAPGLRLVYTKSGARLTAGVVRDGSAVIDHSLYWAPVASENEARYLETVLNAEVTQALVEPYQSRGQLGARHYDMYVWQLPIPGFSPSEPLHAELADLGERAEVLAAGVDVAGVGFQAARKRIRVALTESGLQDEIEAAVGVLLGA